MSISKPWARLSAILILGLGTNIAYAFRSEVASVGQESGQEAYSVKVGEHRWLNNICLEIAPAGEHSKRIPLKDLRSGPDRYFCGEEARFKEGVDSAYQQANEMQVAGTVTNSPYARNPTVRNPRGGLDNPRVTITPNILILPVVRIERY